MAEWDIDTLARIQQALNEAYGPHEEDEWEAAAERQAGEAEAAQQ